MPKTLAPSFLKILLAVVLLLLAAGTAQAADTAIEPALGSGCGTPQLAVTPLFTAPAVAPPADGETPLFVEAMAYCEATCSSGTKISCSGGSCSAKDDPNGYVACDGVYTYCPKSVCSENDVRWIDRGCCCDYSVPRQRSVEQKCVGGQWQDTGQFGCAGQCSSGCLEW